MAGEGVKIDLLGQQEDFPSRSIVQRGAPVEQGQGRSWRPVMDNQGLGYPRQNSMASTGEISAVHRLRIPWTGRGTQGSPNPSPDSAQHHLLNHNTRVRALSKHFLKAELPTTQHNIPLAKPWHSKPCWGPSQPTRARAQLRATQAALSFQPSVRNSSGAGLPSSWGVVCFNPLFEVLWMWIYWIQGDFSLNQWFPGHHSNAIEDPTEIWAACGEGSSGFRW